jgi:hypothetical protein
MNTDEHGSEIEQAKVVPPPPPERDLPRHHRRTDRWLVIGFFAILLLVGGGLIAANYGWRGFLGGILSIVACSVALVGLGGLLWALLSWAGRWAEGE